MPSDIVLRSDAVELVGRVDVKTTTGGEAKIRIQPEHGNIIVGGTGADGDVWLQDQGGNVRIELDSGTGNVKFPDSTTVYVSGKNGNMRLGGGGADGDLVLSDADGTETIQLTGGGGPTHSSLRLLLDGANGQLTVRGRGGAVRLSQSGVIVERGTVSVSGGQGGITIDGADIEIDRGDQAGSFKVGRRLHQLEQRIVELEARLERLES